MAAFPLPECYADATFPLWPPADNGGNTAPHALGNAAHDIPTLTLIDAHRSPGSASVPRPALIIIPGGGYEEHGFDEGLPNLALHYANQGLAVFVLRYRLTSDGYRLPVQLLDGQRAVRTVRARAAAGEWVVDPQRIGVLGFSAGGHLGSMLVTHFDSGNPDDGDPIERVSSRPDAAVLIYPVISLQTRPDMARRLLGTPDGSEPDADLAARYSSHLQVTAGTPPTLLIHGDDDTIVPVENSVWMYKGLQKAAIPSAFHRYPVGKHGFGCFAGDPGPDGWLRRMDDWLRNVAHWRELV